MAGLITYQQCPCCGSKAIVEALTVKDYTVSKELFSIWHCNTCTLRFTQNIPSAENIGRYYKSESYISHTDTQEGFINKLYHFVRNITLQSKKKLVIGNTQLNGNLLDVGAGTGAFSSTMQQAGWQVTGLEPDAQARQIAYQKYQLQLEDPTTLFGLQANSYHAITLWHVLEHVHDLHQYLQQFYTILAAKGKLFIAVPNYTSSDAAFYKEHWAAYDVPRHLYHFSPKSMQKLAAINGFVITAYKPMWFDSVYVSMLSEEYKNGTPNFLKALLNGLVSNLKCITDSTKCSSVIYVFEKI